LPLFKKCKVGNVNKGFANGKSQTINACGGWEGEFKAEPALWFYAISGLMDQHTKTI
jgi:hypothetical protein